MIDHKEHCAWKKGQEQNLGVACQVAIIPEGSRKSLSIAGEGGSDAVSDTV